MTVPSAPRTSRRSFLKLGAATIAAALALPRVEWLPSAPDPSALRVRSALPLPGYGALALPERLLTWRPNAIDVALVPAYVAAQLIQRGWLQPFDGQPGRAHDPEGRYTMPYAQRVAAVRFPNETAAPKASSWEDLWRAGPAAVWPAVGRLLAGAALLRRGYSPNDTHPGHLAQAGMDLRQLRPRLSSPGAEHVNHWERNPRAAAFVLADPMMIGPANGLRLPGEGTMLIEYDWVITAEAARAEMARRFVEPFRSAAPRPRLDLPVRLIPLMPLPETARAQHAEIWASLTA